MASGRQLFDACCRFLGEPYSTAPGRTSPTSGYKDCSGLVAAGYEVAQGYELGAYVSVTIFDQSARQGLEIPFAYAQHIVGAVILKPYDPYQGWGSAGHIAVSDGHGGTCEATPPRVQRLPLSYNWPWSPRAALLPGIDYRNNGEGGAPTPEPIPRPEEVDMYIVKSRETGVRSLYTALGVTQNIDESFSNELQFAGVPYYDVPGRVADSVALIHLDHRNRLLADMGGGGDGQPIDYMKLAEAVNDDAARRMAE